LNEGKPSPIDVQVKGNKLEVLRGFVERIRDTIALIPATRDVRVLQRLDQPAKNIDLDRTKAAELGVEPVDAIKNIVFVLNSTTTFKKAFWIDEKNGNHYYVGVTYPEAMIDDPNIFDNESSKEAVSNSLLALDESVQRQNLGLARPFEIERVQEAFIQSRINYLKSVSAFNILQY
jgi:multidrug efflux pump subunit AcrB